MNRDAVLPYGAGLDENREPYGAGIDEVGSVDAGSVGQSPSVPSSPSVRLRP